MIESAIRKEYFYFKPFLGTKSKAFHLFHTVTWKD